MINVQMIDSLEQKLIEFKEEYNYWKDYAAVNGMGNYGRQVRMESLSKQMDELKEEIKEKKTLLELSNGLKN